MNQDASSNTSDSTPADPLRAGIWLFGDAMLDEQLAALRVGGVPVDLDRSSYDVLLALLRHAGEVVTKDELLEAGWPGRVVSENSLAKAVSRLRQALGTDGESLRAVHGYGYRLACTVRFRAAPAGAVPAHAHEAGHLHAGDPLPHRPGWRLVRRLGQGSAGVIFQVQTGSGDTRAAKLATSEAGLLSLKREIALARYIRAVKGELPDVAPVLDWNLSQSPFFLELPFFEGGNLADWVAARGGLDGLTLPARLQLCARLCDAVAALHEIGIIHRDLKPQNLYPVADVDSGWRLVLSDLGAGEAAQSPRLAELGITMSILPGDGPVSPRAGSLLYMAPEVIAGELPTQRSDVFALGVLIYQLLVGDLRRSLAPGWEADVGDALLSEDIALAAAANPERRLIDARALGGRLRSLEARRNTLAAERERSAAAARQSEQLTRLTRRRRQLVAGSAALAVVLAVSLWQQHRITQARTLAEASARRAEAEAAKTRSVVAFLTDGVLGQADPFASNSGAVTLRQAIDGAAKEVETRFADTPDVAAAIHGTLGGAYEGMNDYDNAVQQYRRQLERLRGVVPPDKPAIAKAHAALCTAWLWQGDLPQALGTCRQARADYVAAGLPPDNPEVFLALADTRQGRYTQALARLESRMARIRRSGDSDLYGFALWFAGIAYGRLGDMQQLERTYAELVDVRRRQLGDRNMKLAWALADHAKVLLVLGRVDEGQARLAAATRMFDAVGGEGHPHGYAPRIYLANHALAQGQWEAARALSQPAFEALLAAVGWQHWTTYAALATMTAEAELGHRAAARRLIAQVVDTEDKSGLEKNHPYLREPQWTALAATHLALEEFDRAEHYLGKLRELAREPDPSPLLIARLECIDAELLRARGDLANARSRARSCRNRIVDTVSDRSPMVTLPDRLLAELGAFPDKTAPAGRLAE